ncbi:major tail protein [Liquorilactobacillus nagelii]|jgi:phi13 family phage major tail protein|uniref:major tail protein n=1 Tax=Liquorilactobacillus nagelii TaxID=82688 RepID=UPI0006EFB933|nr:major tail protein [Liquorilactobacillus nagelii]KRL40786.1 phage-related major tail protein [Liquorilactobacillus nagelii DSM 13675]QYH53751.1 phage tail protein [Liquorilactobacillus nagelii DSM 13675]
MGLVKFGASNFEYGVVDDTTSLVATPRKVPGLSSVKVDLTNDLKKIAADDGPYAVLSGGITEAKETIELYDVDSQMKQDLFGIKVVKGVEVYPKDMIAANVATLFKTKLSNGKNCWVALLKGMFSLPSVDTKTVDGTPDPNADSIEGEFMPRGDQENVVLIGREDNSDFDLTQFRKWVFPSEAGDLLISATNGGNTGS